MITAYSSLIREKKRDTLPQWQMKHRGGNEPPHSGGAQGVLVKNDKNNSSPKFSVHVGTLYSFRTFPIFELIKEILPRTQQEPSQQLSRPVPSSWTSSGVHV